MIPSLRTSYEVVIGSCHVEVPKVTTQIAISELVPCYGQVMIGISVISLGVR